MCVSAGVLFELLNRAFSVALCVGTCIRVTVDGFFGGSVISNQDALSIQVFFLLCIWESEPSYSTCVRVFFEKRLADSPYPTPTRSTIFLLSHPQSREIVKSVLGFCKVAMVTLPPERLEPHLPLMIQVWVVGCHRDGGWAVGGKSDGPPRCTSGLGGGVSEMVVGCSGAITWPAQMHTMCPE